MASKAKDLRPIIKLKSTAGTGYTYVTRKNRRNNPRPYGAEEVRPRRSQAR